MNIHGVIGAAALLVAVSAQAATLNVYPTGTASDILNVQQAILSAQPGDTIVLRAGEFNWSGNKKALAPLRGPFGLPITTASLTITGEVNSSGARLTTIAGPTDASGFPRIVPDNGLGAYANAAFFSGPGVYGVAIRNLNFKNFETVLGLLQTADANLANGYVRNGDFTAGAHHFSFENNVVTNSLSAVEGIGGNDFLTVQNNTIEMVNKELPPTGLLRFMVFSSPVQTGVGNLLYEFNSTASRVPIGIVIRNNSFSGVNLTATGFAITLVGTKDALIENNHINGFAAEGNIGIYFAGDGASSISQNVVSDTWVAIFLGNSAEDICTTDDGIPCTGADTGIPSANAMDAVVSGNHFSQGIAGGVVIEGDHNLIQGNDYAGAGVAVVIVLKAANNVIVCDNCSLLPAGSRGDGSDLTSDDIAQLYAANAISGLTPHLGWAIRGFVPRH